MRTIFACLAIIFLCTTNVNVHANEANKKTTSTKKKKSARQTPALLSLLSKKLKEKKKEKPFIPTVKILLENQVDQIKVEIKGKYTIFNPFNKKSLNFFKPLNKGKAALVTHSFEGIKWGREVFNNVHQITIAPVNSNSILFINDVQYTGSVTIYHVNSNDKNNHKLSAINETSIEDCAKSVLATETLQELFKEALEAKAIVMRTYLTNKVVKSENKFWDLLSSDINYKGCNVVNGRKDIIDGVDASRNIVMLKNGYVFDARMTEHCSLKTADYHEVFGSNNVRLNGVMAPHAKRDREKSKWLWNTDKNEISKLFGFDSLDNIYPSVGESSGKIIALRFTGFKDEETTIQDLNFNSFQKMVGRDKLQSNDFTISYEDDIITFTGYGKGHGVGLCLHSANKMAMKGNKASSILLEFFPGSNFVMNTTVFK